MFLNVSTGGDLKRMVVRFSAWVLMVGLVCQTLVVGPRRAEKLCFSGKIP